MKQNAVLTQINSIKNNPLAGIVGAILGGFVPAAVFTVAHFQVTKEDWYLAFLVLGGLAYSAKTVYQWGRQVFGDPVKAVGFVVLIESSMTFAHGWVPIGALILLGLINGVAAAHALAVGKPEETAKRKGGKARGKAKKPVKQEPPKLVSVPTAVNRIEPIEAIG